MPASKHGARRPGKRDDRIESRQASGTHNEGAATQRHCRARPRHRGVDERTCRELGDIAYHWFEVMRTCGDEVRELLHDSCPVACFGDAPFGYVNVFTSHVNVGFFGGNALPDPAHLLQGTGRSMRHVKLRPGTARDATALTRLIETPYSLVKTRVENE